MSPVHTTPFSMMGVKWWGNGGRRVGVIANSCFLNRVSLVGLVFGAGVAGVLAEVRLPNVFSDHAVLQRGREVAVWGWGDAGEEVKVRVGEFGEVAGVANGDGEWRVKLPAMEAGGPYELKVSGAGNAVVVKDVLVGEVWVCSGQSNMEWSVNQSLNPEEEKAAANFPQIRHLKMPRQPSAVPVDDRETAWSVCSPETAGNFTAAGYYFGREIHRELGVPVGLLNTSWGGTRIEPWVPPVGFGLVPELKAISERVALADPASKAHQKRMIPFIKQVEGWVEQAKTAVVAGEFPGALPGHPNELKPLTEQGSAQQQPTTLFNGMVQPILGYSMRGVLWYQGESNHGESDYAAKTEAQVLGWRKLWDNGEFPYYFVQIAPYQYGNEDPNILARFWEQQASITGRVAKTGMVVIHDVGNLKDIHPKNKQAVGGRLARHALAKDYGKEGVVWSAPARTPIIPTTSPLYSAIQKPLSASSRYVSFRFLRSPSSRRSVDDSAFRSSL